MGYVNSYMDIWAHPSARVVCDLGMWVLASRKCGVESSRGHGCLFLVNVASYQVEVPANSHSLVQRSPIECDLETSAKRQPRPTRAVKPQNKVNNILMCG
jgi:predicted choloylglycine hydrolase